MWLNAILQVKNVAAIIKEFKQDEKKKLANLFEQTAILLEDIAADFSKDIYPIVKTAMLETIAESVTMNLVKMAKRNEVEEAIASYEPFVSLIDEWEKRSITGVSNLLRIAGELKGLVILFRI